MSRRYNQNGKAGRPRSIRFDAGMLNDAILVRASIALAHGWEPSTISLTTIVAYALKDAATAAGINRMLKKRAVHEKLVSDRLH